ncbi:hypothetical protein FRB90_009460 [Tulasnella sp. 427]|nr:hypothetical protein FRB90_009460 [Tulasnella sp. 427]
MDLEKILILALDGMADLFDSVEASLLNELKSRSNLARAETIQTALAALAAPSLSSVLVVDSGVAQPKAKAVTTALVKFANRGGRVIFMCMFGQTLRPTDFNKYFKSEWGLDWKLGSYSREVHSLQETRSDRLKGQNSLSPKYSMKAVMIDGCKEEEAVYATSLAKRTSEAAVVFARFGGGYVGFNGDVNAEIESTMVNLAMLNVSRASA